MKIPRTDFQRRCAAALVLAALFAPVRLLAAEPSPVEADGKEVWRDGSHGHEDEAAGGLIYHGFMGEKIYIQDKGEVYALAEAAHEKSSHERESELAAELVYGVTERLQVLAEVPLVISDPDGGSKHTGLGDVTLGFQYNFMQEFDFSLGVRSGFVIPTGDEDRDLGGDQFVWEPSLLGALRVGSGEVYAGIGGEIIDGGGEPDAFTYTISGAYPWRSLVGVLELAGSTSSDEHDLYVVPGFYWNVGEILQAGMGVPIGLTSDSDDYQIVGLLVFEFF